MKLPRFFAASSAAGTLFLLGLTGCGGGSSPSSIIPTPTPSATVDAPVTTRSTYGPLEFTLTLPKTVYKENESVQFVFTVRNTGPDTVEMATSDVLANTVITQNGKIIYSGSGSAIQVVRGVSLATGQTATLQTVAEQAGNYWPGWPQRTFENIVVPRGSYRFTAALTAYNIQVGGGPVITYNSDERENHLSPPAIPITLQ